MNWEGCSSSAHNTLSSPIIDFYKLFAHTSKSIWIIILNSSSSWITSKFMQQWLYPNDHHMYLTLAVYFYCQAPVVAFISSHHCIMHSRTYCPTRASHSSNFPKQFILITPFLHFHFIIHFLTLYFTFNIDPLLLISSLLSHFFFLSWNHK